MAETLGILTGAIQLVDAALKARAYVNDFRSAPQEQHKLFAEMSHLKPLLAELQQCIVADPSRDMLQQMITPLSNFKTTMESFTAKLRPADGRLSGFSKRLTWMLWSKTEAKEYLEEFERIKTLLNMWLVLDIWHVGQQQHEGTNQMLRSIDDLAQLQKESHRENHDSIQFAAEQQQARHAYATSTLENIAQKVFDQRDELIEWVSPLNFFPRQAEIFSTRQPGTGEWFLTDEKFQAWKSSPGGVLWCQGMPGAGKTILASLVVYHLETECLNQNTGVACIYLNHKETEIQSPPNLLTSLWRQLVFKKPIPSEIKALYAQHREKHTRPALNQLLDQLSALVARYSKVFFIIDALDEYPEEQRYSLLKSVLSIEPRVNLMFTCRPHISSPTSLTGMQIMEIRATESDIRSYVENQIKKSSRLSKHLASRPELKEEIHQQVICGVDGMFLLVKFQMESLAVKHTVKALREALKTMPKDLDHTYEITIQRIISQAEDDREIALRVLTWVSNAKRPLSVRELQEALSVEQDNKTFDSDNILDTDIILSVCAGLVIIDEGNHVFRLVHYTAQEYLDRVQPTRFPKAQVDITATCLTYLSLDTWTDFRADFPRVLQAHPFISYAGEYCLVHARGSPELQLKSRILDFLNHCSIRFFPKGHKEGWDPEFLETWGEIPTILVATSYDLSEIVAGLLSTERPLAKLKNTALWIGASFDAIGTVSLLINAGADIDFEFHGTTSLYRASRLGRDRVARLLVEHGADVNKVALYTARGAATTGPREVAALYQASARLSRRLHNERSMGFAHSLLFDGGDIHDTPLCAAAGMGASAVVSLLIENGANINGIGVYGTALLEATIHGRETVVQLLLQYGADVNCGAIQCAASKGYEGIITLLIGHGADVDLELEPSGSGLPRTALEERGWGFIAPKGGHSGGGNTLQEGCYAGAEAVASLLISNGADVNMKTQGSTALQHASSMGHEGCVRLLIENGADVNAGCAELLVRGGRVEIINTLGSSALHAAVKAKRQRVVQLLLDSGANLNSRGYGQGSLLHIAQEKSDDAMVALLLARGASGTREEFTKALWTVLEPGLQEDARILIKSGADVNARDDDFGTMLQAASAKGSEALVKLLIEKGADINAQGGYYGNALQAAAMEGHDNVVEILLLHGMDVNMTGGVCGNALQAAATEGHENIVQLLLRNVADINLAGGPFSSALEAALGRGHSKVVEILLSYGANQIGPFGTTTRQVAEGTEDRTSDSVVLDDGEVDQDGLDSM